LITPKSLSADACGDNGRNDEAQRHENRRTDFRREAGTERGEHDESNLSRSPGAFEASYGNCNSVGICVRGV